MSYLQVALLKNSQTLYLSHHKSYRLVITDLVRSYYGPYLVIISFSSSLSNYYDAGGRVLPLFIMKYNTFFILNNTKILNIWTITHVSLLQVYPCILDTVDKTLPRQPHQFPCSNKCILVLYLKNSIVSPMDHNNAKVV